MLEASCTLHTTRRRSQWLRAEIEDPGKLAHSPAQTTELVTNLVSIVWPVTNSTHAMYLRGLLASDSAGS